MTNKNEVAPRAQKAAGKSGSAARKTVPQEALAHKSALMPIGATHVASIPQSVPMKMACSNSPISELFELAKTLHDVHVSLHPAFERVGLYFGAGDIQEHIHALLDNMNGEIESISNFGATAGNHIALAKNLMVMSGNIFHSIINGLSNDDDDCRDMCERESTKADLSYAGQSIAADFTKFIDNASTVRRLSTTVTQSIFGDTDSEDKLTAHQPDSMGIYNMINLVNTTMEQTISRLTKLYESIQENF